MWAGGSQMTEPGCGRGDRRLFLSLLRIQQNSLNQSNHVVRWAGPRQGTGRAGRETSKVQGDNRGVQHGTAPSALRPEGDLGGLRAGRTREDGRNRGSQWPCDPAGREDRFAGSGKAPVCSQKRNRPAVCALAQTRGSGCRTGNVLEAGRI